MEIKFGRKIEQKKYLLIQRLLNAFDYDDYEYLADIPNESYAFLLKNRRFAGVSSKIYYIDRQNLNLDFLTGMRASDMLIVNEPHLDKERTSYWRKLKADNRVVVTIDLFRIGLVYFREGQRKENFLIRF
ncbi:hypothetical protein HX021_11080 [Sphingobacterium sp. N143]|uniref:hypothetical protein n=1 Tax=Sphingobacterium sp. N143 TaxID=2746727 RepID=UPI002577CB22|nr:hypothetical protein [Sphingobacterium sp. N143]MDM1294824.1 hypothetical protein [Sphingobacterium sp. N143]